ncbi:hypothetical protein CCP2SC5_690006 [Azospirillaceae bacterium]
MRRIEKISTITRLAVVVQRSQLSKIQEKPMLFGSIAVARTGRYRRNDILFTLYMRSNQEIMEFADQKREQYADKAFNKLCGGEQGRKQERKQEREQGRKQEREQGGKIDETMNFGIIKWWAEVFPVCEEHRKAKEKAKEGEYISWPFFYNTIGSLRSICNNGMKYLSMAVLSVNVEGETRSYLSILTLLGALAELIAVQNDNENKNFRKTLNRLSQIGTYPAFDCQLSGEEKVVAPTFTRPRFDHENDDRETGGGIVIGESGNCLDQYMGQWIKFAQSFKKINYSVEFYARVFSRLYDTLGNMDEEFTDKNFYAGTVLHRQIIALFYAVLVEEILEKGDQISTQGEGENIGGNDGFVLGHDNVTISDALFWRKIRFDSETSINHNIFPLFSLLFSCPMFCLFVDPTSKHHSGGPFLFDLMLKSWDVWIEKGSKLCEEEEGDKEGDKEGEENIKYKMAKAIDLDTKQAYGEGLPIKRRDALRVRCVFSKEKSVGFVNLWAPLHSVMIPGKWLRPISVSDLEAKRSSGR